jgi:competence CoiA-like predicted nuclease
MLVALEKSTHSRIHTLSFNSRSDICRAFGQDNFICPFCYEKVFPRDRKNYILHFFHKSRCSSRSYFEYHPESLKHILGKKFIQESLKKQFCDFEVDILLEFSIPEAGKNGRIADVAVIFPAGFMMIYECQLASITSEKIEQRSKDYLSVGAQVRWLLGKSADTTANRNWCNKYLGCSYSALFKSNDCDLLLNKDSLENIILVVSPYYKTDENPMFITNENSIGNLNFPYKESFLTHFYPRHLVVRELEIWDSLTTEKIKNGLGANTEKSKQIVGGAIGALNSKGIIQKQNDKWQIIREKLAIENIVPLSEEAIKKARQRARERKLLKEKNLDISNIYNTS